MAHDARVELHRAAIPVSASAALPTQQGSLLATRVMDEVRQAVERAVIEDGIPLVQKAAREFATQWLAKHLKISAPSRRT
jgi:hypothetical protein